MCVWHFYFCFCRYRCCCRTRARARPHLLSYSFDRLTPRPSTGRGLISLSRARVLSLSHSLSPFLLPSLSLSLIPAQRRCPRQRGPLSLSLSLARTLILPPPLYVCLYLCLFLSPDLSTQSTSRPWVARKLTTRALSPILSLSLYSSFHFFLSYSPTLLPAPPRGPRWRGG